jgi:hypothetical protein
MSRVISAKLTQNLSFLERCSLNQVKLDMRRAE